VIISARSPTRLLGPLEFDAVSLPGGKPARLLARLG